MSHSTIDTNYINVNLLRKYERSLNLIQKTLPEAEAADDTLLKNLIQSWLRRTCKKEPTRSTATGKALLERVAGGEIIWDEPLPLRLSGKKSEQQTVKEDDLTRMESDLKYLNQELDGKGMGLSFLGWRLGKASVNSYSDRMLEEICPAAVAAHRLKKQKEEKKASERKLQQDRVSSDIRQIIESEQIHQKWDIVLKHVLEQDLDYGLQTKARNAAIEAAQAAIVSGKELTTPQKEAISRNHNLIYVKQAKITDERVIEWLAVYGCTQNKKGIWLLPKDKHINSGREWHHTIKANKNAYQPTDNRNEHYTKLHAVQDMLDNGELSPPEVILLDCRTPGWRDHLLLPEHLRKALRNLSGLEGIFRYGKPPVSRTTLRNYCDLYLHLKKVTEYNDCCGDAYRPIGENTQYQYISRATALYVRDYMVAEQIVSMTDEGPVTTADMEELVSTAHTIVIEKRKRKNFAQHANQI